MIKRLSTKADVANAIEPFFSHDDKVGDDAFIMAMRQYKAQDNQIAKYILSKCYLYDNKNQSIPNYNEVHLEHVLPQNSTHWEKDSKFILPYGTFAKDYIYSLGNLTLLHKQINQSIKNKIFSEKK